MLQLRTISRCRTPLHTGTSASWTINRVVTVYSLRSFIKALISAEVDCRPCFAGDFVDRGAWGTELLAVLAAWKLALPSSVLLLRGNHESTTCTKMYGFHAELQAKYGVKQSQVTLTP